MQHTKKLLLVDPNAVPSAPSHCNHPQGAKTVDGLDTEIRNTLNSDLSDDVKAKLYLMTLKKFRAFEYNKTHRTDDRDRPLDLDRHLSQSFPDAQRHLAKGILDKLRDNPDVSFTPKGQLIYRQSPIVGSDLVDLVRDVLKRKNTNPPLGWAEFARALRDANVPKSFIVNADRWKVMHPELYATRQHHHQQASEDAYATPEEHRSPIDNRQRKRRKKQGSASSSAEKSTSSIVRRWKAY